ncbi:hypothetical protein M378DRAFT_89296 [Amanita muscaria Koide BX008]|uniref:F-box domain-containing protein n=1 Tax=Amanita muscaria (strain Koide BX008) TaxID=946122 RepID=A0A0C2W5N8_AMAMK|nr:hypothetical protein M378DRAFT_89296 [Amanita muscaria Koide BX008]
MNSLPYLLSLPIEVLHELLSHLDWRDLLNCCLVCRQLNTAVKTTSELLYSIELRKYGMIDSGSSSVPHSERLVLLRDRGHAWGKLEWKRIEKVDVNGGCIAYELVGGVFAKSSGRDLFFSWLPSSTRPGVTIHHEDIGLSLRDFAIDPTQDLVVLLEEDTILFQEDWSRNVWLRLRTMSTLKPHPNAQKPDLLFQIRHIPSANRISSAFVQVGSDVLAVFLSLFNTPRLLMWNWKDGRLLCDLTEENIHDSSWDFELVSPRSFMITSYQDSGALLLYKFSYPRETWPVHVATLHLPPLKANHRVMSLASHSGPLLAGAPQGTDFTTGPDSRIQVITAFYQDRSPQFGHGGGTICCFFCVHSKTFQKYIEQYERLEETWSEEEDGMSIEPIDVPWEQWGPKNTHFNIVRSPIHWLRYVQGERVVCLPGFHDGEGIMQVWDFNALPRDEPLERPVSTNPAMTGNLPFRDPVRTSLPYYSKRRIVGEAYKAFMIDEERVIGLKVGPFQVAQCTYC